MWRKALKPCEGCGGEKRPGQGVRYCAECAEIAKWRNTRKLHAYAVVARQPCKGCGGRKEPGHGRRFCARCATKRRGMRTCMSCPAIIDVPMRKCPTCRAVAVAKRREYDKARHRRYRATHKPRRRRTTLKEKENHRINYRLRNGGVTRKPPGTWYGGMRSHIDAAPLVPHLLDRLQHTPVTLLGEVSGVRAMTITEIIEGQARTVLLASADRLCVALGLQLTTLYGDALPRV